MAAQMRHCLLQKRCWDLQQQQRAACLNLVLNAQQTLNAGDCPSSKAQAEGTRKGKAPTGKPKGERQQRETGAKGNSGRQTGQERGRYTCTGRGVSCQVAAGQAGCPEAPPGA